jgi:hypothetical protein
MVKRIFSSSAVAKNGAGLQCRARQSHFLPRLKVMERSAVEVAPSRPSFGKTENKNGHEPGGFASFVTTKTRC